MNELNELNKLNSKVMNEEKVKLINFYEVDEGKMIRYLVDGNKIIGTNIENKEGIPILKNKTKFSWTDLLSCKLYYVRSGDYITIHAAEYLGKDPDNKLSDRKVMINNELLMDFNIDYSELNDSKVDCYLINSDGIIRVDLGDYLSKIKSRVTKLRLLKTILG